jgi:hypothetical protein
MSNKKIHFINTLVLVLLILWFIWTTIVSLYFTTPWNNWDVWVWYLAWLFFIFASFWIFMKFWEFIVEQNSNNNCKK